MPGIVHDAAVKRLLHGLQRCSTKTGAYCTGRLIAGKVPDRWRWLGLGPDFKSAHYPIHRTEIPPRACYSTAANASALPPCRTSARCRFSALITALNEAVTILPSIPTPNRVGPLFKRSST